MDIETETAAVAALARAGCHVEQITVERGDGQTAKVLVTPADMTVHDVKEYLDEYLDAPERIKGTATLLDLSSFIAHVKRHRDDDSVVFADTTPGSPSLLAVYDYNGGGAGGEPRWCGHRAAYNFPLSEEWKKWSALHGKTLAQRDFAEAIEDRIVDVLNPTEAGDRVKALSAQLDCALATPSALLVLSRGLSLRVDTKVAEVLSLQTGEAQFTFEESHKAKDGGSLKVPGAFVIGIPVFRNGERFQLGVRLRYRVAQGVITWTLALHGADAVLQRALDEAAERVRKDAEIEVFAGKPEV